MRRIRTPRARRARPLLVASAIAALGAGCSTSTISNPGLFPDDMSRPDHVDAMPDIPPPS